MDNGGGGALVLIVIALAVYLIPTIVAASRGRAVGPVFILNIFLGWTLLGWVGALVWACTERTAKEEARGISGGGGWRSNASPPKP